MSILAKLQKGQYLIKKDLDRPVAPDKVLRELKAPSFVDLIKVKHYMGNGIFIFREYSQLGAIVKIKPISINNKSQEEQQQILQDIQFALTNSVPNEYKEHWISQIYVIKDNNANRAIEDIKNYIQHECRDRPFTKDYITEISNHLQNLANMGFYDTNANDELWTFSQYDIYCLIYQGKHVKLDHKEINKQYRTTADVIERTKNAFKQVGILCTVAGADDYVGFLAKFIHNKQITLPKSSLNTLDLDLSALAIDKTKITYTDNIWSFSNEGNKYSNFLRIDSIDDSIIKIGHLSSEQKDRLSLLDRLPGGSIYTQTIIHIHPDVTKEILSATISRSKGTTPEVKNNRKNAEDALKTLAEGDLIYRFTAGVFISANNRDDLDRKNRLIKASFDAKGLLLIKADDNPINQDDFICALPFGYDYITDQKFYKKNAFLAQSHILAKLSPFYARDVGTDSALFTFFNRGGQKISFDPLKDYAENAFALIFGSSGAGKSATLVYLLMQLISVYNPRIFIIEKGESFSLLVKYCKSLGLSTHRIVINSMSESMPLSPFADAYKVLEQDEQNIDLIADDKKNDAGVDDNRDVLNELIIIAKLMITGGEEEETKRFRRHHHFDVGNAIRLAAKQSKKKQKTVLTEDIIAGLKQIAKQKESDDEKDIINGFADSMNVFINSRADKRLFNTPGETFPEVDITQFDVGNLGDGGNQDKLVVAFISLMMRINNIAERDQHDKRPIIVLGDEAHLYATNPLLAPYIVKIAKMWRKLGAWLWLATQSLDDFTGASERMINTMEWLVLLSLKTKEVAILKKFVDLSPEQEKLLKSTVEQKLRYKEGVIFNQANAKIRFLFRNIPPPLALALGMTAPDEKTKRQQLMKQHNCSELEAAILIADEIKGNLR